MDKHQSRIIILVCLVVSIVVIFFAFRKTNQAQVGSPEPVPAANAQAPQSVEVGAPDGKFTLIMKTENGKDTSSYTFLITDETKGTRNQIFTVDLPKGTTLAIPQNTFSSDDKYIFLEQNGPGGPTYFVLTSSGAPMAKDAQTLDFSSPFKAKYPNYMITEATGWAGPTLVVINTNNPDSSLGPSFWFDVASKSFIRLSTRFN